MARVNLPSTAAFRKVPLLPAAAPTTPATGAVTAVKQLPTWQIHTHPDIHGGWRVRLPSLIPSCKMPLVRRAAQNYTNGSRVTSLAQCVWLLRRTDCHQSASSHNYSERTAPRSGHSGPVAPTQPLFASWHLLCWLLLAD